MCKLPGYNRVTKGFKPFRSGSMKTQVIFCFSAFLSASALGSPLHDAVVMEDRPAILQLLNDGADIKRRDKLGRAPLHIAAQHGSEVLVSFLVARGADVNQPDEGGRTPLQYALTNKVPETLEIIASLLERGASADVQDKGKPEAEAIELPKNEAIESPRKSNSLSAIRGYMGSISPKND